MQVTVPAIVVEPSRSQQSAVPPATYMWGSATPGRAGYLFIGGTINKTAWATALSSCCAYVQVYNDVLYDLLDINASPSELTLYEDASGQLQVCHTPW